MISKLLTEHCSFGNDLDLRVDYSAENKENDYYRCLQELRKFMNTSANT